MPNPFGFIKNDTAAAQGTDPFSVLDQDVKGIVETSSIGGIPVQQWEWDVISGAIAQAEDYETEAYRWANALQMSRLESIDLATAYENLDALNLKWLGKVNPPKTATKAIVDSWSLGRLTNQMNDAGIAWMLSGGKDAGAYSKYKELEAKQAALADNVEDRSLITEALKAGAQSVPFTLKSAAYGGAALGIGALATGGLSAPASVALYKWGSTLGSAVSVAGLEYTRMMENGVTHEVAMPLALASASVQGVIETALGADRAIASLLSGGALKSLSSSVASKVLIKGIIPTIATRAATRYVMTGIEEAIEEGTQELSSWVADAVAAEIMELKGVKIDRETLVETMGSVWESAKQGALASAAMGIIGIPLGAKSDYKALSAAKEAAKGMSRESFKAAATAGGPIAEVLESVEPEKRDAVLDQVWEGAQREAKADMEKASAKKAPDRIDSGALYTGQKLERLRDDGTKEVVFKAGSPKTGDRYGYIRAEITDDEIVVLEANVKKDYEGIRNEIMLEMAASYPGLKITTGAGSTERAKAVVEALTEANPRGAEAGAQWFTVDDTAASKAASKLRARLIETMPNMTRAQVETGIMLHELRANAMKLSFDKYMEQEFSGEVVSTDNDKLQALYKDQLAAEAGPGGAIGGVQFKGKVSVGESLRDAKALVYVSGNADFTTWVHESGHVFRKQLDGTDLGKQLDEAMGIAGGVWTRDDEERFVDHFLGWLSKGEVKEEKLKGVFHELAKWLVRLFKALTGAGEKVDPRISSVLEQLFTSDTSGIAQASAAVEAEFAAIEEEAQDEPAPIQADEDEEAEEEIDITPAMTLDKGENPVRDVPVADIQLSEDVPNFKEGANAKSGAVEPLKSSRYERLGTAPIVVWERKSGRLEVITGRHRLDLARRLGERTIPAQVVREADGFTQAQAMTFDAEANIRDGQGSVRDYANYFRNTDTTFDEASSRGLLSRDKGRAGFFIGKYAEDGLYALYRAGKIGEKKVAAIAEAAPNNQAVQEVGIKKSRDLTAEELFNFTRLISMNRAGEASQADMFGNDESFMVEAEKTARAASARLEGLVNERAALEGARRLGKAERAKILDKYGVKAGDAKAIEARLETLESEIEAWKGWTTDPKLMRQARIDAGLPVSQDTETEEAVAEQDTETPTMFMARRDLFDEANLNNASAQWFGVTTNPDEAGYILSDGRMLDFSGKNQLGKGTTAEVKGGTRRLDHAAIANIEGVAKKNPVIDYMKRTGAIRVDFERGAAYSIGIPSFDAAARLAGFMKRDLTIHIDDENGDLVGRKIIREPDAFKIAAFYSNPTKPETDSLFAPEDMPAPRLADGNLSLFQTETPEFRAAFGSSKVVDENGKPQKVYHGTAGVFDRFDEGFMDRERNWSFTDSREMAQSYQPQALDPNRIFAEYEKLSEEMKARAREAIGQYTDPDTGDVTLEGLVALVEEANSDEPELWAHDLASSFGVEQSAFYGVASGQMVEAYLRLENPIERWFSGDEIVKEVRPDGEPDGYIDYNVMDTNNPRSNKARGTVYHVKSSDQIIYPTAERGGESVALFQTDSYVDRLTYKAEAVAKEKLKGPMPGKNILSRLRSNGVKDDELAWTGLDTFLDTDEKITPQAFMEYLGENRVRLEEVQKELKDPKRRGASPTHYDRYVLPGGENYREVLVTLPLEATLPEGARKDKSTIANLREYGVPDGYPYAYKSVHWSEPNVLAHTRLNDRTLLDGRSMIFIEEIQSDWHQEGRKKGYKGDNKPAPSLDDVARGLYGKAYADLDDLEKSSVEDERDARINGTGGATTESSGLNQVPDAPFKKTWHEMVFRRIVLEAVAKGYDTIGWTTGEQQAERYNLSKSIGKVSWNEDERMLTAWNPERTNTVLQETVENADQLESYVGKELAQKLASLNHVCP